MEKAIGCLGTFLLICIFLVCWAVDGCATACNPKETSKQPEPQKTSGKVPEKVPDIEEITIIKYN